MAATLLIALSPIRKRTCGPLINAAEGSQVATAASVWKMFGINLGIPAGKTCRNVGKITAPGGNQFFP
jgi:hypothetical protein